MEGRYTGQVDSNMLILGEVLLEEAVDMVDVMWLLAPGVKVGIRGECVCIKCKFQWLWW